MSDARPPKQVLQSTSAEPPAKPPILSQAEPAKPADWRTLLAAIFIVVTGAQVVIIQPVVVQGLVEYQGYSAEHAGYILSAEMWGFAVTTIAMVLLASRYSWRKLLYAALAIMLFGNLGPLLVVAVDAVGDVGVFGGVDGVAVYGIFRFAAGLGAGGLVSLGFAIVGLLPNPDRNYGFAIAGALLYGAVVVPLSPRIFQWLGFHGLIGVFVITTLIALCLVKRLPIRKQDGQEFAVKHRQSALRYRLLALVAMLTYFAAQGAVWSYLFLIGTASGISEASVASSLGVSQLAGLAGASAAAILAARYGRALPLTVGILLGIGPLILLINAVDYLIFAIAVCCYNFGWNMTHPYLLAVMATLDETGRTVVNAVAMQKIGLAIGPALAAMVLRADDKDPILMLGIVLFSIALALIFAPASASRKLVFQKRYEADVVVESR